jgi:glutathione S-transferase
MKLYEHGSSGNCLKCRLVLRALDLSYESVEVDLFRGETRTDEHFARNPDGRIPVLETDDGRLIPESGAILLHLAEGTPLLPAPGIERSRVHQWMFFE